VGRKSIPDYYDQSDFMLNASNIDNMPMSILEAFSSGIPVISTEAGGIPYIIRDGENGMLVSLDDDQAMAEKAIYLLENQRVAERIAEQALQDCVMNIHGMSSERNGWGYMACNDRCFFSLWIV